jgi:hypothetical protein
VKVVASLEYMEEKSPKKAANELKNKFFNEEDE